MTEQEWLACTDPQPMLRFLLGTNEPRVQDIESFPDCKGSDRQLRLFACACYHRIRHLIPNELVQAVVEVAERFADGLATLDTLELATTCVREPYDALEDRWRASRGAEHNELLPTHVALALALQVVWSEAPKAAYYASSNACHALAMITNPGAANSDSSFTASLRAEGCVQADILRCIFGNPFRPVSIPASVIVWQDAAIPRLAQRIYEERSFADMRILGYAIQQAGCVNTDILDHCLGKGPHTRGCWVVDQILGKALLNS